MRLPSSLKAPPPDIRELSRAAFLAAVGLVLPPIFHVFQLGRVFLPMFLPILAGGYLLKPKAAVLVAFSTPLISAGLTGMPPFFPPVAIWMSLELSFMALTISLIHRRTSIPVPVTLAMALLAGRLLYAGMVFITGQFLQLPAAAFTLIALVRGWPGMILCMIVVPATVATVERNSRHRTPRGGTPPQPQPQPQPTATAPSETESPEANMAKLRSEDD